MKPRAHWVGLWLCLAAFAGGLGWLLHARFEAGDVYPPYSSLRADPLGTMAFYEALGRVPGLDVSRDFTDTNRLPATPDTTYLHLAGEPYLWSSVSRDMLAEINAFLRRGGRLVIVFYPQMLSMESWKRFMERTRGEQADDETEDDGDDDKTSDPDADKAKSPDDQAASPGDAPAGRPDDKPADDKPTPADDKTPPKDRNPSVNRRYVDIENFWGLEFDSTELATVDDAYASLPVRNRTGLPLPEQLDWHSGMFFKTVDPAWRVIYARAAGPVLLERTFGAGSVVLASDSFFTSNEAMRDDRHAALLAWLVGGNRRIVFDENHFGIYHRRGVATLLRHYGLDGFIGALLVLAGLFIWKNSTSLVPPPPEAKRGGAAAGRAAAGGFINLLHRHVPPADLLAAGLHEWRKTPPRALPDWKRAEIEAVAAAEAALPRRHRDPVAASRRIAEILRRTTPTPPAPPANPQPTNH